MTDPSGERWYALNLNPEPWAVGPLDLLRRKGKLAPTMGRNQQVAAYQQAVKSELEDKYAGNLSSILPGPYELDMYFWRNTERANVADGTNMLKSTEDALQGILLTNDREVRRARWEIVQQGPEVASAVVFWIRWGSTPYGLQHLMPDGMPEEILSRVALFSAHQPLADNTWPPR